MSFFGRISPTSSPPFSSFSSFSWKSSFSLNLKEENERNLVYFVFTLCLIFVFFFCDCFNCLWLIFASLSTTLQTNQKSIQISKWISDVQHSSKVFRYYSLFETIIFTLDEMQILPCKSLCHKMIIYYSIITIISFRSEFHTNQKQLVLAKQIEVSKYVFLLFNSFL